jgi:histidinol-phosphate phosphatase family protein
MMLDKVIDKTWTLFLDRDGVINTHRPNDYVKSWDEFEFIDGALEALAILSQHFGRIIIVSNQQGIGKGVMTRADLDSIHDRMCENVRSRGGNIDAIYTATILKEHDTEGMRKPGLWMAHSAQKDFPEIDFAKSVMVGDSMSDMRFGRNAGMTTVCIGPSVETNATEAGLIDERYHSLFLFSKKF